MDERGGGTANRTPGHQPTLQPRELHPAVEEYPVAYWTAKRRAGAKGRVRLSTSNVVAVSGIVAVLGLCYLVTVCLRGAEPDQRPTILRALGEVLHSLWPFARVAQQLSRPAGRSEGKKRGERRQQRSR
jgi:hypothetical protein